MRKILFVITKGNFGGAQRYVYDLAVSLPRDEYQAVVACGDQDGDTLKNKLDEAGIRTLTIKGSGREVRAGKDFSVLKQILKLVRDEQPEVLHLNSSKIGFLGVVASLYLKIGNPKLKIRTIFTIHGWAFNEKGRSSIWRFVFRLSYYLTILGSDQATAVSEKTKRAISSLPFIKNKIRAIHNGIDKFETISREEARGILNGREKTLILSIGELHPSKGLDIALQAISRLKENIRNSLDYRIVGGGEEKEKLEKLAQELGLQETVRFLGPIDNAKNLLSGADIFLLPSRNENLPYTILEAGLVGLPIIATSVGGIPEIIKDMQSGILVHKENPREIAAAIEYFLENPERQREFGAAIQKQISQNFSKEKMVRETIELYK